MVNMCVDFTSRSIDDAYHGALLEDAYKIIKERKFIPTKKEDSYVGDGVYFYEGSRWLAADWVERNYGKGIALGIICATVYFGRCLNLNIPEHRSIIKIVREKISQQREIKTRGIKITDSLVVNYYTTNINKTVDTIRMTYIYGGYGNPASTVVGKRFGDN